MRHYNKVNKHLRSNHRYYQPLTTSYDYEGDAVTSASTFEDETVERFDKSFRNEKSGSIPDRENSSFVKSDDLRDLRNDTKLNFMDNETGNNGNRFTRTLLNATDVNYEASLRNVQQNFSDAGSNSYWNENNDQRINENDNDDSIEIWSESRTPRMRRDDERRGKIRPKKKRRPNRSRRRLGIPRRFFY